MSSTSSLMNLDIQPPALKSFKGIAADGESNRTFNSKGELSTTTQFGRTVKKIADPLRRNSKGERDERQAFRKELTDRRAKILCSKSENQLNIETQLLDLVVETSNNHGNNGKTYVEVKPFLKQIQQDICVYFTNEIRQCTSPTELIDLHLRIKSLKPESKYDRDADRKLDAQSIKDLQNELNKQCDRVMKQLKIELDPKLNQTTEEVNSDLDKSSTPSPPEILENKCRDIICWIDTIRDISPDVYGARRETMCQLLRDTYLSGLDSINDHSDDLNETQKALSKISEISETVSKAITENSVGDRKTLKAISTDTLSKQRVLEKKLNQLPNAVENYKDRMEALDQCREKLSSHLIGLSATKTEIKEKQEEINTLQLSKKPVNIRERKLPLNFNRKINNKISEINKTISSLKKELKKLSSSAAREKEHYDNLKNDSKKAKTKFLDLVNRFGSSLKCLDGLGNVPVDNDGNPEPNAVLSAMGVEDLEKPQIVEISLPKALENNKSLSKPENMEELTAFINEKISSNPELSKTLPSFLEVYSKLMQPVGNNEWTFDETFENFTESCNLLSDNKNSVTEAETFLYSLLKMEYEDTSQKKDDVYNKEIESVSEYNPISNSGDLAADISEFLKNLSEELSEKDEIEVKSFINDAMTKLPAFVNLTDEDQIKAINDLFDMFDPAEDEVREFLINLQVK